jgi:hypothetical protein
MSIFTICAHIANFLCLNQSPFKTFIWVEKFLNHVLAQNILVKTKHLQPDILDLNHPLRLCKLLLQIEIDHDIPYE